MTVEQRSTKTSITANERLQLIGLFALAKRHDRAMADIKAAAQAITGEIEDCGHTSDAIYDSGSRDVEELLGRLNLTVDEPHR